MWLSRVTSYIWLVLRKVSQKKLLRDLVKTIRADDAVDRDTRRREKEREKKRERANARPTSSFDRNSRLHGRSISRGRSVSLDEKSERGDVSRPAGQNRVAFDTEWPMPTKLSTYQRPRVRDAPGPGLFCLSRIRSPGLWAPGSPPVPPSSPFITIGKRSPLLITVDEQPCVSSYFLSADDRPRPPGSQWSQTRFRCAYARNRPEPTALKQSPQVGRLTEFQLAKNWEIRNGRSGIPSTRCRYE